MEFDFYSLNVSLKGVIIVELIDMIKLFGKAIRKNENEKHHHSVQPGTTSILCKQWINNPR